MLLADFLADDSEDEYDWLVPGFLERGDRLIVTASEGGGKSTLVRQWGVQMANGVHPFDGDGYEPIRVLHLDLENSRRQLRREFRKLPMRGGHHVVVPRPAGMDLLTPTDRNFLRALVDANRPDILVTGPIYKMVGGKPTDEEPARTMALFIDELRVEFDIALLLEAHSAKPNADGGGAKDPYGASLWRRWPEFGIHIGKDDQLGEITHWRGARDEERKFPKKLRRGGQWPWTVDHDMNGYTPNEVKDEAQRIWSAQGCHRLTADGFARHSKIPAWAFRKYLTEINSSMLEEGQR